MDERTRSALEAVRQADAGIDTANQQARAIQQQAGDARALAIAALVDVAGRQEAARLLDVRVNKIDQAIARARGAGAAAP